MCASEPESLTLKIMKAFKSLDLLDYNGRLLVLGLAPSISHKCRRNLHIESSGNYWDDIKSRSFSPGVALGTPFPLNTSALKS